MVSPVSAGTQQVAAQADQVNQRQKQQQDEIRKAQQNQNQPQSAYVVKSPNDHDQDNAGGRKVTQNSTQSYNVSLDVRA